MIKEASGNVTTAGAPINLTETSYDDVYGRMGLFKIGVGYRTTPRTEGVFNFVLSRSSAETVDYRHGGLDNVPLAVDFDDFNYWGLEGGQRFFFAAYRFTPYVGYLVGLNRNGDISGHVRRMCPRARRPASRHKTGSSSRSPGRSVSVPRAGFLIGVGPFEVMAETQLRFMNGLSDVDWLVEEGLRDINTESSRWSIPFIFGARIRF